MILIIKIIKKCITLFYLLLLELKDRAFFIKKPVVINFMVTGNCNSKCIMCNIWKTKKEDPLTVTEFSKILKNKLFSKVVSIGIAGGEPTLRNDLFDIVKMAIDELPKLKNITMLSNSLEKEKTIDLSKEINNLCVANGKTFLLLLSLDGMEKTHDINRGINGSFNNVIDVINYLKKNTNILVSIGCTITKENIWDLDGVLSYCLRNRINYEFRIAEFIKRLNNLDLVDIIKNFTNDEKYNLLLFFKKLEIKNYNNYFRRSLYNNIFNMLKGEKRKIDCIYNNSGIVLNENGDLSYCSVASKILGNALDESSYSIYLKNLKERKRIIKECCSLCIHDNSGKKQFSDSLFELKYYVIGKLFTLKLCSYLYYLSFLLRTYKFNKTTIYITGWYGTETVGDKAILGGIINYYKNIYNDDVDFVVSSLYPFVTEKTIQELMVECKIVDAKSIDFIKYSKSADIIVMGGGPLFDGDCISFPLLAFEVANKYKKKTVIMGCGYGPLFDDIYIQSTNRLLQLADEVFLRDKKSVEKVSSLTGRRDIKLINDMSIPYVGLNSKNIIQNPKNEIACFFREWDFVYMKYLDFRDFLVLRQKFEFGLAQLVEKIRNDEEIEKVRLYHMHNFVVGADDRDFSRKLIGNYFPLQKYITYDKGLSTIDSVINAMRSSKINLCMRFHSVVFADTLNVKYYAIDYSNKGKIYHFLKDRGKLDNLISIENIIGEKINTPSDYYGE